MTMYLASLVALTAALAGAGPNQSPQTPATRLRNPCRSDSPRQDRRTGFRQLEAVGHSAGKLVLRRRVCATGLSGRDRHAAHGRRGAAVPGGSQPQQAFRGDRPPAGAQGVRRLLGDEVGRSAAGQGGVPHQPVAQRGRRPTHRWIRTASSRTCPTTSSPRELLTASGSNFRVPPGQLLPRHPEPGAAGHRPGRGADLPGRAGGQVAATTASPAWRPSSRRSATSPPRNGRRRSSSSIAHKADARTPRPARCSRRPSPTAPRGSSRPDKDPARGLRRLAGRAGESLVRAATSPTASGPGCWGAASSTSRTTFAPTIRREIRSLLAYLERELVAAHYDLKHLYRLILNSKTYQLVFRLPAADSTRRARPISPLSGAAAGSGGADRRLDQITGTTEHYSSTIPEPFTFIPEDQRSIALADGSISSPFLDVRPSVARHRPGIGAQQSFHGGTIAAPAEFHARALEDRPRATACRKLSSRRRIRGRSPTGFT